MIPGILFALTAAMTWGLVYVLEQKILFEISVMKLLFLESVFFFVISVPAILFFEKFDSLISPANWRVVLSPAFLTLIFINFAADYLILRAVQLSGATFASMFEITFPLFVAIFAFFILRQPIHWMTLVGGSLIISGSMLIIYFNQL